MTLDLAQLVCAFVDTAILIVVNAVADLFSVRIFGRAILIGLTVDTLIKTRVSTDCHTGQVDEFVGLTIAVVIDSIAFFHRDLTPSADGSSTVNTSLNAGSTFGLARLVGDAFVDETIAVVIEGVADLLARSIRDLF